MSREATFVNEAIKSIEEACNSDGHTQLENVWWQIEKNNDNNDNQKKKKIYVHRAWEMNTKKYDSSELKKK